jgi:ABC-2 type transport system ATP-binding protein
MSGPLVEVTDLRRTFGSLRAVDGLTFSLAAGSVVGLIGANGAGKTTTMRILATLDAPDSGSVRIRGFDIVEHPERVRPLVGWMPDHFAPYNDVTVVDYLDFFARACHLRGKLRRQRVAEAMAFTELESLADRLTDRLSKGEMQRLCLARTLLSDPDLLILDEPAAGLDPKARIEFRNLVRLLRERGKTLLISSHILSELGEMCDTLVFMDGGRVMHQGDSRSLTRTEAPDGGGAVFDITIEGPVAPLVTWLSLNAGWRLVEERRDGARAAFSGASVPAELRRLTAENIPVVEFRRVEQRLEDAFVNLLRDGKRRSANQPNPPA